MAGLGTQDIVFGYFSTETQAEAAVRALMAAGFTRNQISIAGQPDSESYSSSTYGQEHPGETKAHEEGRKAGEAVGGFWGRIRNFLEGDPAEPYADQTATGGRYADAETGTREISGRSDVYDYDPEEFHASWGAEPTERSRYFSQRYGQTGEGIIVSVNAGDRRAEAERILESNGADLGSNVNAEASYAGAATPSADVQSPRRIQLYGEVLRVHRDRVEKGEVRLRKETVTETQNVQVPVTREELVIERVPVSGEQPASGVTVGSENEEIRIPLTEEQVRVEKQPVVREQVEVGKRQITNTETRQETVRREELRVEDDRDNDLRKAS